MQANYVLFLKEILKRKKLENPRYGKSKGRRGSQFFVFSPTYKIILLAIVSLLVPESEKERRKILTYKKISDACRVPIPTVKEIMPIIRYNFPYYFNVIERKIGKGYSYKLNPNFAKQLDASNLNNNNFAPRSQ